jgi:membrane protein
VDAIQADPRRPRAWLARRTLSRSTEAGFTDLAAALAYHAALAILPMVAALVALLGLFGNEGTSRVLLDAIATLGPQSAVHTLKGPIEGLVRSDGTASVAAIVGLAAALWAASGYVGGFIAAANRIHGVEENRSVVRRRALQLGLTACGLLIVALALVMLGLSGPLLDSASRALGLGSAGASIFSVARWPLLGLAGAGAIAILARHAPALDPRPWHAILAGTALSTALWLIASAGFALYVATLGSYEATYAALAGPIVFLVWLWISNLALLLGIALNATLAEEAEAPVADAPHRVARGQRAKEAM